MLAELFAGRGSLLEVPQPATIKSLIAFQAFWDRHPSLYEQICQVRRPLTAPGNARWEAEQSLGRVPALPRLLTKLTGSSSLRSCPSPWLPRGPLPKQVWNTAYAVVAARQGDGVGVAGAADFSFRAFMEGPVARVRRKPARAR